MSGSAAGPGVTLCAMCCMGLALTANAQGAPAGQTFSKELGPTGTPLSWLLAADRNEIGIVEQQGTFSVLYRERKIDGHGDTTRLVVESRQGGVARLVERNGKPITAAEDNAERERLEGLLRHPDDFVKHHEKDSSFRNDAIQMLKLMPDAMLYSYAPGQPQREGATTKEIVLDFVPNPAFKPPSMMTEALTGLEGRFWIDPESHRVTRAESRVLRPVNFGFGIVARLYPGGTLELEQEDLGNNHWIYSRLEEHVAVRAMMVKTMQVNLQTSASNAQLLPELLDFPEAIRKLLAIKIPIQ